MKLTRIAETVLPKRYLRIKADGTRETPAEMLRRVARVVASAEAKRGASEEVVKEAEERFYRLMDWQDFMPNSPTFTGAGTDLGLMSACFVLPIGDSLPEIYETLKHDALIHQAGGGTGHAFSRLRPKGSMVRSSQGVASGPVSFLRIYNASTEGIKQGGTRRGANMGILRVDHPDILEFLGCKTDTAEITNFNISVAITDAFMEALENGADYALIDPRDGKVVGRLSARTVWNRLVKNAWKTGEPGIFFVDRANRRNPNGDGRVPVLVDPNGVGLDADGQPVKELIEATNPCGDLLAA